jgi:hypothetical protein
MLLAIFSEDVASSLSLPRHAAQTYGDPELFQSTEHS